MAHEFDGKRYEKASTHQQEWGRKLIAELGLKGRERVLDLGCGDGSLTAVIAGLLPEGEVVGIDASRGMIDAALPKSGGNLYFRLLDIDDLDFDNEFDLIFSNAALHWVKDHEKLLRNVRRALRPGGRVRFNFAGEGNCMAFFRVICEAMSDERFRSFFAAFEWPWFMPPQEVYHELAEVSGLRNVEVWDENADRYFPDADTIIRWIDQPSIVPFLPYLPESERLAFRDFVVRCMIEETQELDGRCFETFRRINFSAIK
ncbi:MAG TPA: methyltransferase domain-containing protein [Chlorobaculum parvum]|uniref:Methyltransferase domain-containing protein n=1 Tax=Chlorobaculum parvum TaxID=274539 RepID=A0A7C5DG83_9CHLB|nr:methyltransferase domain-containing protein [Chlorobaculum parvum]